MPIRYVGTGAADGRPAITHHRRNAIQRLVGYATRHERIGC